MWLDSPLRHQPLRQTPLKEERIAQLARRKWRGQHLMPSPLLHVHLGQNLKECKQGEAMIEDMGNRWMYQPLKPTHLEMTHLEMTYLGMLYQPCYPPPPCWHHYHPMPTWWLQ